jgi:1-deoxy-D-xylulose-5-phosphate synthase
MYPLLEQIDDPVALRRLDRSALPQLARELRAFVLTSVAKTGGHLSSNLGTIELTIALHYVFDTPRDRIVWDVGHQTYAHKILTGRRARMDRLRMGGGPSGFPRRSESPYDTFGTAHSSTSISAALGMAVAAKRKGESRNVIAVIGDGAMSAGMAFEALNNAGTAGADLLVVLNDNEMSISEPVGALDGYLAKLLASRFYNSVRRGSKEVLSKLPPVKELAKRWEEHMKGMVLPGTLFEELGFNYIGPIDGHDLDTLVGTLDNVRALKGPQLLHVITRKGYGYARAEDDPILYHGVTRFDPALGVVAKPGAKPSYTQVFGDWVCDMAAADPRLVAITPAMREGSGLVRFSQEHPARYFDVGIAEQHAVTFAAGLACEGLKPVVAIYSTFLQRAYDQLIHDVALQNLPVVFAIDRAGVVGADGATHIGAFDLSYLRCLPNTTVMAPADENECRRMLSTAFALDTPAAVRYPRGAGPGVAIEPTLATLPVGKGEIRRVASRRVNRVALLAFGTMLHPALVAAEEIDATVANMRFVKPLDVDLVAKLAREHDALVTIEENVVMGGAGSAVAEALAAEGIVIPLLQLGLPDAVGIAASVQARFGQRHADSRAKPAA